MGQLSFQYPVYYLWLCLLVAIAGSVLLYYKSKSLSDKSVTQKLFLAILRGLSILFLGLLLMNPLLKSFQSELKKPQLSIALDQSESMNFKDSSWKVKFNEDFKSFKNNLSDKYQIDQYYFASKTDKSEISKSYTKRTSIEEAFTIINDQSNPQLLKGVILISDGIYNSGRNPYYHNLVQTVPIFSVFHGDSVQEKDLVVQRVYHNEIIYSGDKFSILVDLQAWHAKDDAIQFKLEGNENNLWKTIYESKDNINSNSFFLNKEIIHEPLQPGIYKFRVSCSSVNGERNIKNNSQQFILEVLDARKKVLIYALGPHPDLSAIKSALESNKNYQVDIQFTHQNPEKLETYNLVIFHQLPSVSNNIRSILNVLNTQKISRFFIVGQATNLNDLNNVQDLIRIAGSGAKPNESQAIPNQSFNNFTLSDGLQKIILSFPPINAPFGNYESDPIANILLYQRIGKVDTKYPLLLFSDKSGIKTGVLCGEGIWKWKFNEFVQTNSSNSFNELISKIVQYTSVKEDRRKFRVITNKKVLGESEDLIFNAELYNDSYERINIPDVSLQIISEDNKKYDFTLGKKENYYELNVGTLPPGDYRYASKTNWMDREQKADGRFVVVEEDVELNNLVARPDLLRGLSEKSNGRFFYESQLKELQEQLLSQEQHKPILFQSLDIKPFIDYRLLMFLVLLLLSAEWFLRRYWGSY